MIAEARLWNGKDHRLAANINIDLIEEVVAQNITSHLESMVEGETGLRENMALQRRTRG
jgi:hypothetical protein